MLLSPGCSTMALPLLLFFCCLLALAFSSLSLLICLPQTDVVVAVIVPIYTSVRCSVPYICYLIHHSIGVSSFVSKKLSCANSPSRYSCTQSHLVDAVLFLNVCMCVLSHIWILMQFLALVHFQISTNKRRKHAHNQKEVWRTGYTKIEIHFQKRAKQIMNNMITNNNCPQNTMGLIEA